MTLRMERSRWSMFDKPAGEDGCRHEHQVYDAGLWICQSCRATSRERSLVATLTNTGGRIGTKPEPGIPLWLIGGALFVFMVAISVAIVVSAFSGTGCP